MNLIFEKPDELSNSVGSELMQLYNHDFYRAVDALAKVIDDEILVPLVLPDEKHAKIKGAIYDAVHAARTADQKIEMIRTAVQCIAESLYGGAKGLRGY